MIREVTTHCLLCALFTGTGTLASAASAAVEFVDPEKFIDAGRSYSPGERAGNPGQLRDHLIERAGKLLPAEQKLSVTVTDVDLAGDYDKRQSIANEVRIVREVYPPRIKLTFKLEGADGSVLKEGSRDLTDLRVAGTPSAVAMVFTLRPGAARSRCAA